MRDVSQKDWQVPVPRKGNRPLRNLSGNQSVHAVRKGIVSTSMATNPLAIAIHASHSRRSRRWTGRPSPSHRVYPMKSTRKQALRQGLPQRVLG